MKLLFASDLHGFDAAYEEFSALLAAGDCDVGVLGGDLMTYPSDGEIDEALRAMPGAGRADPAVVDRALAAKERSYRDLLLSSGKPVVFIMGNDDGLLGSGTGWTGGGRVVGINQRRARFGAYSLVGYQYSTPFVGGTFEKPESDQEEDFAELERKIDAGTVLVTHGPPFGTLDLAADGRRVGSRALRRLVERRPPRVHLFGHIHWAFGRSGNSVNGSYPVSRQFAAIDLDSLHVTFVGGP